MYFWRVKLEGGLMTPAVFEAERAAWLRGWEGVTAAEDQIRGWISAYTSSAITPEDARKALAALPEVARGSAPPVSQGARINLAAALGKVLALAGDAQAALPHLEAAAAPCLALEEPTAHIHNQYRLGAAREALGDRDGACAAYRVVLDRWGHVEASVTAREAAKRSKALDCEATSG